MIDEALNEGNFAVATKESFHPDYTVHTPAAADPARGDEIGTLFSTQVFMRFSNVVRVVETDLDAAGLLAMQVGRMPAIRELEHERDVPRDMSIPSGSRAFISQPGVESPVVRRHDG